MRPPVRDDLRALEGYHSPQVDVAVRWQIDPMQSPSIFREIGGQEQIQNVVLNAIVESLNDEFSFQTDTPAPPVQVEALPDTVLL